MKTIFSKAIIFASLISPMAWAGTGALTAGVGKTSFDLIMPKQTFTSADWTDLSLTYTNRFDAGGFFNVDYRTSLAAEHDTFADDSGELTPADLDDTRLSVTLGGENWYVGLLKTSTDIKAPEGRTSGAGAVSYDLIGMTLGFKAASEITDGHYFQYGAGVLMAEADLKQVYINSGSEYNANYDATFGYFYGLGFSGPLGTTGLAYALKYEVQKIDFESYENIQELEDKRSRISASLTYVFL
tara:strand:- start:1392 stop:2117 length:726 start_codon:yes stop_codon:yes gene_type:complete